MPNFAVLAADNVTVANVVVAADAAHAPGGAVNITGVTPQPGIGWTTPNAGVTWVPPAPTTAQANQQTINDNLPGYLATHLAFLQVAVPNQAQVNAQLTALTKAVNALLYLAEQAYSSTQGT